MTALDRIVPARLVRTLTRYAMPLAIVAAVLLVAGGVALAAVVSPGTLPGAMGATKVSETASLPETLRASLLSKTDEDRDGLADALENYYYGTDASNWNSSGTGIPDGWLEEYGYDPLNPALHEARGATPPRSVLPAAYGGEWPETFRLPLSAYYAYGTPSDYVAGESDPWWTKPDAKTVDPTKWDLSGSGIPTSWLLHYGLDPFDPAIGDRPAAGGASPLTVNESYRYNTNPLAEDSDGDGLTDLEEIETYRTDPGRFSTTGLGVADGWLVHFGINPLDPAAVGEDVDRDGLSNADEFFASHEHFRGAVEENGMEVLYRRGLDPRNWQTSGSGIPDGWYVTYGLDPFDAAAADRVLQRASDYDAWRHFEGDDNLPEGAKPIPDLEMTVRDAYTYNRPSDWDEATKGVWWGGTNPNTPNGDSDSDGLPDAVEIRGWYIQVAFETGKRPDLQVVNVTGNPMKADSDGDGLTDLEEYRGSTQCGAPDRDARTFPPTNVQNKDTAFSGLTDREKVCEIVRGPFTYDFYGRATAAGDTLNPTRADSAGDGLKDGLKVDYWHERYARYLNDPTYEFKNSRYGTVLEWTGDYARFNGLTEEQVLAQFRPDGDADGDALVNILDEYPGGQLLLERFHPSEDDESIGLRQGHAIQPLIGEYPRSPIDPANPDTDGDGLPDYWEVKHQEPKGEIGRYYPDPAYYDTFGDGTPDGDEDRDNDGISKWYKIVDGQSQQQPPWPYTNVLEFKYGTNPNEEFSARDGVNDGWKAFWGREYPVLVQSGQAGEVVPDAAALQRLPLGPSSDLKEWGGEMKRHVYARFLYVDGNTEDTARPQIEGLTDDEAGKGSLETRSAQRWEVFGRDVDGLRSELASLDPALADVVDRLAKAAVAPGTGPEDENIARIVGVLNLTFQDEVRLGTNPYLYDTDGDGMPDAYEHAYKDGPNPVVPDGRVDLDGDTLPNVAECHRLALPNGEDVQTCQTGTDPLLSDTDLDGRPDDLDPEPLTPTKKDANADTDADGLPDFDEVKGWGSELELYDTPRRTSSLIADTDGDGALDYSNRAVSELSAKEFAEAQRWATLGYGWMSHPADLGENLTTSLQRASFIGENAKTDPCKPDTAGDRIPDGWIVYMSDSGLYTGDVRNRADAFRDDYEHLRPDWWLEPTAHDGRCGGDANHGVWWWGRPPTEAGETPPADLDRDGLHDTNGEDPFPTHGLNRYAYDGLVLTNPADVGDFVNAATDPGERLARAQALGEWAGNPIGGRANASARDLDENGIPDVRDRALTAVKEVQIVDGATPLNDGYSIEKAREFTVTGRVDLAEDVDQDGPIDLANLTVLVSLFRPSADTVIGAGYTDANGNFALTANLTPDHIVNAVPEGGVLFGHTQGPVQWSVAPDLAKTGPTTNGVRNALVVWTYNTSVTLASHPARAELKDSTGTLAEVTTQALAGAVSAPVNLTITSDTRFEVDLPDPLVLGGKLRGNVTLTDASGAPLALRRVSLTWTAGDAAPIDVDTDTDGDGRVKLDGLNIPLSLSQPADGRLTASFESSDPSLMPTTGLAKTRLVYPSILTVETDRTSTSVGEELVLTGTLRTLAVNGHVGGPLGGETVHFTMGRASTEATTGADGTFRATLRVPGDLVPGETSVAASFPGNELATGAKDQITLEVRRTTEIVGLQPAVASTLSDFVVTGKLLDNNGGPVPGRVALRVANRALATADTGEGGLFVLRGSLNGVPLGLHEVRVTFAGDTRYTGTTNFTTVKVVSPARLEVTQLTDPVLRGDYLSLEGRLTDALGRPIDGGAVEVTFRGKPFGVAITDGNGRFTHTALVNETARLGDAPLGLRYTPPESSVYRAASAEADTTVQSAVTLQWDDRTLRRGTQELTGRLADDQNLARPGSTVHLSWAAGDVTARTTRNGSFSFPQVVPSDLAVGDYVATVRYAGAEEYAATEAQAKITLVSSVRIRLDNLASIVRGEPLNLHGELLQDNGDGVTGTLRVTLGGVDLGEITARNGVFNATLDVPLDVPRDEQVLVLTYAGTDHLEKSELNLPVRVKIRPKVEVEMPSLTLRGFAFEGQVRVLDDQGEPLRDTPFVYTVGNERQTFLGRTDENGRADVGGVGRGDATYLTLALQAGPGVLPSEVRTESIRVVDPALGTPLGLAVIGAGIALLGAAVLGIYLWRRRQQIEEVREILQEAIQGITAGNEYSATIFLAYKRLAAHLGQYGFTEQESDTAREFVLGVRRAVPVSGEALRKLIRIFEKARYSEEEILATDRDEALKNLVSVRNELDTILGKPGGDAA